MLYGGATFGLSPPLAKPETNSWPVVSLSLKLNLPERGVLRFLFAEGNACPNTNIKIRQTSAYVGRWVVQLFLVESPLKSLIAIRRFMNCGL